MGRRSASSAHEWRLPVRGALPSRRRRSRAQATLRSPPARGPELRDRWSTPLARCSAPAVQRQTLHGPASPPSAMPGASAGSRSPARAGRPGCRAATVRAPSGCLRRKVLDLEQQIVFHLERLQAGQQSGKPLLRISRRTGGAFQRRDALTDRGRDLPKAHAPIIDVAAGDIPVAVIKRFAAADASGLAVRQATAAAARAQPAEILHRIAPTSPLEVEDAGELLAVGDKIAEPQVAMAQRESL